MIILVRNLMALCFALCSLSVGAQVGGCVSWLDQLSLQCKRCGSEGSDGEEVRYRTGGLGCVGCYSPCRYITPRPSQAMDDTPMPALGALAAEPSAPTCQADFSAVPGANYYAINITDEQLAAVSKLNPGGAMIVATLRTRERMPPIRVDGGEGVLVVAPTAAAVMHYISHPDDEEGSLALSSPLPEGKHLRQIFWVEPLKDGWVELHVRTTLQSNVDEPNGPAFFGDFVLALKRTDETRPMFQIDDVQAQVYEAHSWRSSGS